MKNRIIALALCAVLLLGSCSDHTSSFADSTAESNVASDPAPNHEVATPPAPSHVAAEPSSPLDLSSIYTAYADILTSNSAAIAAYYWQSEPTPIAIRDITGDSIPELMYLMPPLADGRYSSETADLYIATFHNGKLKSYKLERVDVNAGGGTRYVVFTAGEENQLCTYTSAGSESWTYIFSGYTFGEGSELVKEWSLVCQTRPSEDYSTQITRYELNGKEISSMEYENQSASILDGINDILIWSMPEDQPIWERVKRSDALAISFSDALAFLKGDTKEPAASDYHTVLFTEEDAKEYLLAHVAEYWGGMIPPEAIPENLECGEFVASSKMLEGNPIYLVDYSIYRIGAGRVLLFADGSTVESYEAHFMDYQEYFDLPIQPR